MKIFVSEQPGFILSTTGILFSIIISLAVKSALAPEKILALIDRAAARVDKRLDIKIENAQISLADGFIPEIAVVVQGLQVSSEEKCWMRPQLEIDELKLPIRFLSLLSGEVKIHQIHARNAELSLRESMASCQDRHVASLASSSDAFNEKAVENNLEKSVHDLSQITSAGGKIDEIEIKSILIHYLPVPFSSFRLKDYSMSVISEASKKVESHAVLYLAGETLSGDYSSTAKIQLNYSEELKPMWNFLLSGQWREGHYQLNVQYHPLSQDLLINTDLSHIPLSQLFPLLKKYKLMEAQFNGKEIWLTLRAHASGLANQAGKMPVEVENLKIEGRIGEVTSDKLSIESLDPFKYSPFELNIKALHLDEFFSFIQRPHPSPMLGKLGTIHGKASIGRHGEFNLEGDYSGLEFLFSNRGIRQAQTLSLISGTMQYSQNQWNVKVDRIKPTEGVFLGKVSVVADRDWKKMSVKAKIDDLTLGPSIQKLMTGGGEIGPMSADFTANYLDGNLKSIDGYLTTSEIFTDQLNFKNSRFNFSQVESGSVRVDVKMQGIEIPSTTFAYQIFYPLVQGDLKHQSLNIRSIHAQVRSHFLNDLNVESSSINLNDGIATLIGGWDKVGSLHGEVQYVSGKSRKKYSIIGHRDQPQLVLK